VTLTCSALEERGLDEVWRALTERRMALEESGELAARRRHQRTRWLWTLVDQRLRSSLEAHPDVRASVQEAEADVAGGRLHPAAGAQRLLGTLRVMPPGEVA
jgi:LAO/AO transport system kinase